MIGFLLNVLASLIKAILHPFCFIFGAIDSLLKGEFDSWQKELALTKDKWGNVLIKYPANRLLITKEGYQFGNYRETISKVLGINKYNNTLTSFGRLIDSILEFWDEGHTLNAAGIKTKQFSIPKKWYLSKAYWLQFSIAIVPFFMALYSIFKYEWLTWPIFAAFGYCLGIAIVMIVYAWIINPIKSLFK